jgi:hypothetical protein
MITSGASGCAFMGVSLEAHAGASLLTPAEDADPAAQDGLGWHVGLTASLEVDVVRGSDLGMGLGYVMTGLPESAAGERASKGSFAAQYWMTSAIDRYGTDSFRPRAYLGVLWGAGESSGDASIAEAYGALGASWHPRRGTAWHVFAGPHVIAFDDGASWYTGWGGAVRLRWYRSFFPDCDLTPSEAAAQNGGRPGKLECR